MAPASRMLWSRIWPCYLNKEKKIKKIKVDKGSREGMSINVNLNCRFKDSRASYKDDDNVATMRLTKRQRRNGNVFGNAKNLISTLIQMMAHIESSNKYWQRYYYNLL